MPRSGGRRRKATEIYRVRTGPTLARTAKWIFSRLAVPASAGFLKPSANACEEPRL
ncbi:hypothetical protein CY34DRAFT_807803 [Suillus luteus UH-Slu-Lm8-n1]|uniref:Uncharacterized protein n=1 Tax=Suillus luteus UH-Slu-Lm8-n1 TaxID=930992 RepID=A0A0D0AZV4_9AGAM|nr:hypothetical protein CY34DRAFT_807803 [Suillus luteus UH-Slu-Lm8-n1]